MSQPGVNYRYVGTTRMFTRRKVLTGFRNIKHMLNHVYILF